MPAHVDSVEELGRVLDELRRSRRLDENSTAGPRVQTLNFVVFIDDPKRRDWVIERALRVIEKHPSRFILLDSTGKTRGVDVSSERIDVDVATLGHDAIAHVTRELSMPGVPTVVWWTGARLLASRTFAGLVELASAVVVDSSGSARDEETIRELGEFLSRHPHVILDDMAFLRLAPWMDMIAQFFDDPALREDLFSLTELHIESGSEAEALYLAGWLGSRLSWEPLDGTTFRARSGHSVSLSRVPKGSQRRVISVSLVSEDSRYTAALSDDDPSVVCLSVEGAKAKPTRCAPLQNIDNLSLIERAFLTTARDPIFETSLLTVRELLG
jgi:glucose-6-phosphate dehydrogenase assembly protein OpcA